MADKAQGTAARERPLWRIYYDDGSTFDSTQGEPHESPPGGFICAVGFDENGDRYITNRCDHYRYDRETEQWWGSDREGVFDRLRSRREYYAYCEGRTVGKNLFQEIMDRAHRDEDFKAGLK